MKALGIVAMVGTGTGPHSGGRETRLSECLEDINLNHDAAMDSETEGDGIFV